MEKEHLYKLFEVHKSLDDVRGKIRKYLAHSSVCQAFFYVRRKESRRKSMLGPQTAYNSVEESGLIARNHGHYCKGELLEAAWETNRRKGCKDKARLTLCSLNLILFLQLTILLLYIVIKVDLLVLGI